MSPQMESNKAGRSYLPKVQRVHKWELSAEEDH